MRCGQSSMRFGAALTMLREGIRGRNRGSNLDGIDIVNRRFLIDIYTGMVRGVFGC